MTYDHKIIQNFKRESKNKTYKVLYLFWGKIPHFDYHQGWIFVTDDSENEWGQNLVCYVMALIHAYLESAEPPDCGHQKKCFHYD